MPAPGPRLVVPGTVGLWFWHLDIELDAAAIGGMAKAQFLICTVSVSGETLTVFSHRSCPFTSNICPCLR